MGALFYAGSFLWLEIDLGQSGSDPHALLRLVGPVLTGIGFLAVVTEAGRPSRAIYLLHHLHRSWMSREVLCGGVFIATAFGHAVLPMAGFKWLAIGAAVLLAVCQAMMLYDGMGVTLWYAPIIPLQCLLANAAAASFLLLALFPRSAPQPASLLALAMVVLVADGWAWYRLLGHGRTIAARAARASLYRADLLFLIFGLGHLVPLLILISVALLQFALGEQVGLTGTLMITATVLTLAGGLGQKAGVVLGGNSLRPMRRSDNYIWSSGGGRVQS
jgi:DMSO reductase anchor subunit